MRKNSIFSRKVLAVPYAVFLLLFVIIPLVLIIVYAFSDSDGGFTINNFTAFFSEAHNINTLLVSVIIGFLNTFICLLIGYPVAMLLAKKELGFGKATVLLFVMPALNFVPK